MSDDTFAIAFTMSRRDGSSSRHQGPSWPRTTSDQYNAEYGLDDLDISPLTGRNHASPYYGTGRTGVGFMLRIRPADPVPATSPQSYQIFNGAGRFAQAENSAYPSHGQPTHTATQGPSDVTDRRCLHSAMPVQDLLRPCSPGHIRSSDPMFDNFATWAAAHDMQAVPEVPPQSSNQQEPPAPVLPIDDLPVNARLALSRGPAAPPRQSQQLRIARECVCPLGCIATRRSKRNIPGRPLNFGRHDVMLRHLRTHHGLDVSAEYQCLLCDDERGRGAREDLVSRHCSREHPDATAFGCSCCYFRTMHRPEWRAHFRQYPNHNTHYPRQSVPFAPYRRVAREPTTTATITTTTTSSSSSSHLQVTPPGRVGPLETSYLPSPSVTSLSRSPSSATHSWQSSFPNSSPSSSAPVYSSMFAPPPWTQTPASSPPSSNPMLSAGRESSDVGESRGERGHETESSEWGIVHDVDVGGARGGEQDGEDGFDEAAYLNEFYE